LEWAASCLPFRGTRLQLDPENHRFVLYVDKDELKNASGFDKDQLTVHGRPALGERDP